MKKTLAAGVERLIEELYEITNDEEKALKILSIAMIEMMSRYGTDGFSLTAAGVNFTVNVESGE